MLKTQFILISKRSLTHDVYELAYSCSDLSRESIKPGQYTMFQLAPGLNRSYSIASYCISSSTPTFTLVIKRIGDGKGSPMICDAEIGQVFSGMIPLGHFVLRDTPVPKCFIGTGTGFAPLYCQMLGCIELGLTIAPITFVFGVRNIEDSFYDTEIMGLSEGFSDFQYVSYFSRALDISTKIQKPKSKNLSGYVTDWITPESISPYREFYICGSPAMVKSAREKLEALGVENERVFWEQF